MFWRGYGIRARLPEARLRRTEESMTAQLKTQLSYLETAPRLKYLPQRERPVSRVIRDAESCNLVELLAAIVGGAKQIEIAEALLAQFGDIHGLYRAHATEIANVYGIGESTAARIQAALCLGKRTLIPAQTVRTINSPKDAADIVCPMIGHKDQEIMLVVPLNTRNQVMDVVEVYRGSVNSAQVRIAELFRPAIQRNAPAIILAHNHPSSDVSPSREDISLTRSIVEAGKLIDIGVLDHLIVSASRYTSLKERKLAFA
jgi:DNA repair protein RadC